MRKYKNAREVFLDMFTEPNNENISLILVLTACAFLFSTLMEMMEFHYTHKFPLGEYIKEMTLLFGSVMAIYTTEKLGRKYVEKTTTEPTDSEPK